MKKARENRNGKPMKQKPKLKEEKKKLNIKKRWDHLSSVNAKHWTSLLQNMLHFMAKKTGRFLHMKEMSLLSITMNWAYGHAPHTGDAFVDVFALFTLFVILRISFS